MRGQRHNDIGMISLSAAPNPELGHPQAAETFLIMTFEISSSTVIIAISDYCYYYCSGNYYDVSSHGSPAKTSVPPAERFARGFMFVSGMLEQHRISMASTIRLQGMALE